MKRPADPRVTLSVVMASAAIGNAPVTLEGQTADGETARTIYETVLADLLLAEPADSVVVVDSTIPVPGFLIRTSAAGQPLPDQLREAIALSPAAALPVLDSPSIGRITVADFQRLKREVPTPRYRAPVAVVSFSMVFMRDQRGRALVYVVRWQGPQWSSGSVVELTRRADTWVISSRWGQWAT